MLNVVISAQKKRLKSFCRIIVSAARLIYRNLRARFDTKYDVITVRPHVSRQVRAGGGLLDAG